MKGGHKAPLGIKRVFGQAWIGPYNVFASKAGLIQGRYEGKFGGVADRARCVIAKGHGPYKPATGGINGLR